MDSKNWLKDFTEEFKDDEDYDFERKVLDVTEKICMRMNELNMSKKDLAKKLGKSPAFVTKLLNGNNNFTFKTLHKLSKILRTDLNVDFLLQSQKTKKPVTPIVKMEIFKDSYREDKYGGDNIKEFLMELVEMPMLHAKNYYKNKERTLH